MQISTENLIAVRHLIAGGRPIQVLLTRNEGGSVAGQCLLEGAERPIIDGPTVGNVLAAIEDSLEALVFARRTPRPANEGMSVAPAAEPIEPIDIAVERSVLHAP